MPSARAAAIWPGGMACSAPRSTSASRQAVCSVSAASAMLNLDTPPPSSMGSTKDANSSCVTSGTPRTASISVAAANEPAGLDERRSSARPAASGTAASSAAIARISVTSRPPQRSGPMASPPQGQPDSAPAASASAAMATPARARPDSRPAPSATATASSSAAQATRAGPRCAGCIAPNSNRGRFSPTAAQQAPAACAQAAASPRQTALSKASRRANRRRAAPPAARPSWPVAASSVRRLAPRGRQAMPAVRPGARRADRPDHAGRCARSTRTTRRPAPGPGQIGRQRQRDAFQRQAGLRDGGVDDGHQVLVADGDGQRAVLDQRQALIGVRRQRHARGIGRDHEAQDVRARQRQRLSGLDQPAGTARTEARTMSAI